MDVLRKILAGVKITCFAGIYEKTKRIGNAENSLIPNVFLLRYLIIVNPPRVNAAKSCSQEQPFSNTRQLKTWLGSTMTNRRFNLLGLLSAPKELTDELDLAEAGNEFISLNEERFQYFGKFVASDFT